MFWYLKLSLFIWWGCYQIEVAIAIFSNFPYAITKWLKIYSDKEFQFSDSVFLFITLLKVLCAFAFLFLVEELFLSFLTRQVWASQVVLVVKNPSAKAGDTKVMGSIPEPERPTGEGHGKPLQYSFLENPMDRGAWWATVHSVAQSKTRLKWLSRQG